LMAGAAGLVYALYNTTVWYAQGFEAGLIAFTAAVMGGIGNLQGAVLGGVIIGCIQQISDDRINSTWTPAIVFGYLILSWSSGRRVGSARRHGKPDELGQGLLPRHRRYVGRAPADGQARDRRRGARVADPA